MATTISGHTATSNAGTTATSVTLSVPSGAAAGDLLIAYLSPHTNTLVGTPSGWTALQGTASGTTCQLSVFSRVMVAGDTNWSFSWGATAVKYGAGILGVAGWDGATGNVVSNVNGSAGALTTPMVAQSITTGRASGALALFGRTHGVAAPAIANWTLVDDATTTSGSASTNSGVASYHLTTDQVAAGATGDASAVQGGGVLWVASQVTLALPALSAFPPLPGVWRNALLPQ